MCFERNTNTWVCKLLQPKPNIRDYDWTLHPCSLFISIYCERETHLNFCERQVFMTYKLLQLRPNTWGYEWTFYLSSLFILLLFEIVKVWIHHFDFNGEKSLMLGQAFDLCCEASCENGLKLFRAMKIHFALDKGFYLRK